MSRTILQIEASPAGAASASRRLAAALVAALCAREPGARVVRRDLAQDPPALVDAGFAAAIRVPPDVHTDRQRAALAVAEALIGELEAADLLVIGTPMHNYTVPAVLKAWIDQVLRINRSFRSTPAGKVGLLKDRPTFVVSAAGGLHAGDGARQPDFLTPYLTAVLATIGIRQVAFLPAQGLSRDPTALDRACAAVPDWVDHHLAEAAS